MSDPVSVRLDSELRKQMERQADSQGLTLSAWLRWCGRKELQRVAIAEAGK